MNIMVRRYLADDVIDNYVGIVTCDTKYIWCVCVCVFYVTYNKGVGSGFRDVYNSYRIMIKRLLPK